MRLFIVGVALGVASAAAFCLANQAPPTAPPPKPGAGEVPQAKPGVAPELGTLTAGDVFAALGIDGSKLEYLDEPPGKLRELRATVRLRDTQTVVAVRIQLRYTPDLMSTTGKWDTERVRAAKVLAVTLNGKE